jgi:hypothetical protein
MFAVVASNAEATTQTNGLLNGFSLQNYFLDFFFNIFS